MEQVRVELPEEAGGGYITALRFQDLPAEHVIAFLGQPPGYKEFMAKKLFILAAGEPGELALEGLTYGELEEVISEWMILSADTDSPGVGLDWTAPWV